MKPVLSRLNLFIPIVWVLSACGIDPVKTNLPLDLNNPGSINIAIESPNDSLAVNAIKAQISKNLKDWAYPISTLTNQPPSHVLTIVVDEVDHGSTPTGFSFSMGDSDPRALEFQKADVLPITCRLNAINQPAQSAELKMGFSDSAVTGPSPNSKELADHASTVCFNLLRVIKWPVKPMDGEIKSDGNSWIPEIRIETETEAATPVSAIPSPAPDLDSSQAPESTVEKPKAVTKEITKEGRKIYIIHNQGHPITFKFGHERN